MMRKWNGCCGVAAVVAHLLEGDAQLALGLADPLGEAVSAVTHEERHTLLPLIITATRLVRLASRPTQARQVRE